MNYFNFLVSLSFSDFYIFINPVLFLTSVWLLFFKINSSTTNITKDSSLNLKTIKVSSNSVFIEYYYFLVIFNLLIFYTFFGKNSVIWFNHFELNNFTFTIMYFFFTLSLFLYLLLKVLTKKSNLIKSIDYLFSLSNVILLLPYLFLVNTVFTFLFLLELVSVVLLYKLISSKIWFKSNNNKNVVNNTPQFYINMIFFQYWVTFFSTIFIVYFYINIFYLFGSSDCMLVQFLSINFYNPTTTNLNIRFILFIFIFSVFIKMGITPFHLFKIEVYKGIPLLSIFFYTTYYFSIFFLFFLFFLSDFLGIFASMYYNLLTLIILGGSIYTLILIFDVNFLKAFFAYSTIINSIGFLITFISLF